MIDETRITHLNDLPPDPDGRYVLYWMQAAQRARYNHALEYAVRRGNEADLPVVVLFGITDRYPGAHRRHYAFMLEGLLELHHVLADRGIQLVIRHTPPQQAAVEAAGDAALVVTDCGYMPVQRSWRAGVAGRCGREMVQVETDAVVPVQAASEKQEYAARTLRPKVHRLLDRFLVEPEPATVKRPSTGLRFESMDLRRGMNLLEEIRCAAEPGPVDAFAGGESAAREALDRFIDERLPRYDAERNDPNANVQSDLSPYLHFGQISPLEIALRARAAQSKAGRENIEAFLEELIVRRELSMNHVWYSPDCPSYDALPEWARKTLDKHRHDKRDYTYDYGTWERGQTHDPYWNAAQTEMVVTGKMAGYMRMYWGKKILEWSASPQEAFETALELNDTYELDGRDPNSVVGVAWCFGLHDRPWKERPVYGTVRYMNANGLKRKFDADKYVETIKRLNKGTSKRG